MMVNELFLSDYIQSHISFKIVNLGASQTYSSYFFILFYSQLDLLRKQKPRRESLCPRATSQHMPERYLFDKPMSKLFEKKLCIIPKKKRRRCFE